MASSHQAQQQQQPPSSTEKRAEVRRAMTILDRSLAGPVASVWTSSLIATQSKKGRASDDGQGGHGAGGRHVRFTLSKTEDAMDSVIPCAAEEFFRPMMQSRFGNPAKLSFRYTSGAPH